MILSGRFLKSLRFLTVKHPTEIYFRYWWQMTQVMLKYFSQKYYFIKTLARGPSMIGSD